MRALATVLTAVVLSLSPGDRWITPLPGPVIERIFDLRNGPYQAGHRGLDLHARQGDTVLAPTDGTVTFSGTVVDRGVLTLRTTSGYLVSFEPVSSALRAGDSVQRGDTLGVVAGGGHCRISSLHVGVRSDKTYLNPLRFFPDVRPRLLPLGDPAREVPD